MIERVEGNKMIVKSAAKVDDAAEASAPATRNSKKKN